MRFRVVVGYAINGNIYSCGITSSYSYTSVTYTFPASDVEYVEGVEFIRKGISFPELFFSMNDLEIFVNAKGLLYFALVEITFISSFNIMPSSNTILIS